VVTGNKVAKLAFQAAEVRKPPANRPLAQIAINKRQSIADSFLARGRPARPESSRVSGVGDGD
jgi:hypothetical protein